MFIEAIRVMTLLTIVPSYLKKYFFCLFLLKKIFLPFMTIIKTNQMNQDDILLYYYCEGLNSFPSLFSTFHMPSTDGI